MNFSSISGVLISIAAVIWVALIIPVWTQRNQNKEVQRANNRVNKVRMAETKNALLASRQIDNPSVNQIKKLAFSKFASGLALAFSVAVTSAGMFSNDMLIGSIGFFAALTFLVMVRRFAVLKRQELRRSLSQRSRPKNISKNTKYLHQFETSSVDAAQGWKPNSLPAPMNQLNRTGTLEQPVLAEVKQLELKMQAIKSSDSIDEILRRRRAN